MKLWNSFRNYFYQRNLRRQLAQLNVKRSVINLDDAKSIGILFDWSLPENEVAVSQFVDELKASGKQVEILSVNKKKEESAQEGIMLLNNSDVSWSQIPEGEVVIAFANKNFDLLLCLFIPNYPALEYIARISRARWRVGCYSADKTDFYDLMIHMEAGKDLANMIEQCKHFLNQIHYDSKQA